MPKLVAFIGPDKTGSTWLHQVLSCDPDIATPGSKETFYFDRNYELGDEWFRGQFEADAPLWLDVSHDYLFHPLAPGRLHRFDRDAILIVGIRNPIDRLLSACRYMQVQGRLPHDCSVEFALSKEPELIEHGLYGLYLDRWLQVFPPENLVRLDFDLIRSDSRSAIAHVRDQAGWPPLDYTDDDLQPTNIRAEPALPGPVARAGRLAINTARSRGMLSSAQAIKKAGLIVAKKKGKAPDLVLASGLRDELTALYRRDLQTNATALGWDLASKWGLDAPSE